MWAVIQQPASCQFVKRAIDDSSSSKRPLIILKNGNMNWTESTGIVNFQERSDYQLSVGNDNGETPKASKCLQFPSDTTCASSSASANSSAISQQELCTPTRLPTGVSPIQSHPYGLVLQAFPGQLTVRPSCAIPLPIVTSTPIASKSASRSHQNNPREPSKTVLTVHYPSKTMNRTLSGSYLTIGKALAHGVPSQIANAVMKNPTLRNHVIENTLKIVSKEVAALCSQKNPSLLRKTWKTWKEDLAKFDLQDLCNEWKVRAPLFYSFLMTSAVNKRTKECSWFPSMAIAGSVLLKQRSEKMNAVSSVLGVLLKSKSIEVSILNVMNEIVSTKSSHMSQSDL